MPKKNQFKAGQIYATTAMCDSDCVFRFEVTGRTEKSVYLKDLSGIKKSIYRVKITDFHQESETCSPLGSYSMSPTISALDVEVSLPDNVIKVDFAAA